MESSRSPRHQSPQSDLSGQYALRSTISQLTVQKRHVEMQNQSLVKSCQQLQEENRELKRALNRSRIHARDLEPRSPRQLATHNSNSSSPIELHLGAEAALDFKTFKSTLHSDLLTNKLNHDNGLKQKMGDLVAIVSQKLAQEADLQNVIVEKERKVSRLQAILNYTTSFFSILQQMFVPLYGSTSRDIPNWLTFLLEKSEASSSEISQVWRLLQWNLHQTNVNRKHPTSRTQEELDEWYAMKQEETENAVQDPSSAWIKLHSEMRRDLNIQNEPEVPLDPADSSPAVSSSGSSLSSKIPAEELWKFKSIMQSLIDKYEELYEELTRLRTETDQDQDNHDIDNDLYLPQQEALETYDLGGLIKTMNSVIESLSKELANTREQNRCESCGQNLNPLTTQQVNEPMHQSGVKVGHPSESSGFHPVGMPYAQPGPSYGLQSRASRGEASRTIRQPIPLIPSNIPGALPKFPMRPIMNASHGGGRVMRPQQITRIQNTNTLTRSKSDSSSEVLHRRQNGDQSISKPSSLDSVFSSKDKEARTRSQRPPVQGQVMQNLGQSISDSDEEYEVRGPPDSPPEVKALQGLHNISLESPETQIRDIHQVAGGGGSFGASEEFETLAPESYALHYKRIPDVPYSQVQQCTSDNISTRHDMLLPTSVDWTTLQLKQGGIQSPTLEGMNRFSSSMNMAKQSLLDRKCPICKIEFPQSESQAAIFDHIQVHYQSKSPPTTLEADVEADALSGVASNRHMSENRQEAGEMKCPICQVVFPAYVPLQARNEHINLHLDASISDFEVVKDDYK